MNWFMRMIEAMAEGRRRQADYLVKSQGGFQPLPGTVEPKKTSKKTSKKTTKKPAKKKKTAKKKTAKKKTTKSKKSK